MLWLPDFEAPDCLQSWAIPLLEAPFLVFLIIVIITPIINDYIDIAE